MTLMGSAKLCAAIRRQGQAIEGLVRDFVQRALGGSVSPFVAYLTRQANLTEAELADLKRLVRELEAAQKESRRA